MDLQKVREKYKQLPKSVRDALLEDNVPHAIDRAGKSAGIDPAQHAVIADAIAGLVAQELTPPQFVDYLKEGLQISYERARKIAATIKQEVFVPTQDELEQLGINISDIPS